MMMGESTMDQALDAKKRWASRHTQIKITVNPEIADSFKKLCLAEGVSITKKLTSYMRNDYPVKPPIGPYTTRQKRRKAVDLLIRECEAIMRAEQCYVDRMPENLESSAMHDAAEHTVDSLAEALELLRDAF
jgi:hypothetical protein